MNYILVEDNEVCCRNCSHSRNIPSLWCLMFYCYVKRKEVYQIGICPSFNKRSFYGKWM
jgi:hypothetical protein